MAPFKPGRGARVPAPTRVAVQFGEPISASLIQSLSQDELVAELEKRMRACHAKARRAHEGG